VTFGKILGNAQLDTQLLYFTIRLSFLLTAHLSIILGNDQLDTQLLHFTLCLLCSSTCFEHYMLIIRRVNCIDAGSGIVTLKIIEWSNITSV